VAGGIVATGTIKVYLEVPRGQEAEAQKLGAKKHTGLGIWFVETLKEATEREEPALKFATPWSRGLSQTLSSFYRGMIEEKLPLETRSARYAAMGRKLVVEHFAKKK
jgi:hypothetical protein